LLLTAIVSLKSPAHIAGALVVGGLLFAMSSTVHAAGGGHPAHHDRHLHNPPNATTGNVATPAPSNLGVGRTTATSGSAAQSAPKNLGVDAASRNRQTQPY
jgi:hypothetical protein